MTQIAPGARRGSSARRPEIPGVAWRRAVGLPCPERGRPRVTTPLIDDGEWAGVPLGGLGTGSIGPTYRGDIARWHLEVGRHAFRPIAADGFSLFVGSGAEGTARVLSTLRPSDLPAWGWGLPIGAGTYHALFPRAWWAFEPETVGVRLVGEQLSPVIAGDYDASALPTGVIEWWVENPTDLPLTVSLMLAWRNPLGARPGDRPPAGPSQEAVADEDAVGVVFRDGGVGPTGLRGSFAIAAARGDDVELSVRPRFDAIADTELWADFAADGRLDGVDPGEGVGPIVARRGEALGGAAAATTTLEPGESRNLRFAIAWDLPIVEFGSGRRWWKRYTRDWGRSGERAWDLAGHALKKADEWRAAIERWQAPVLADSARPDWYKAALFNELYYLVDGGSFWEAGEVDGPEPEPDDPGRFALMESFDYPFYDSVDVDFYASAAILELFPALERRGIRDLLGTVAGGDADVVEIEATGARAVRKLPGVVPHDIGGPDEDPFLRPNRYRFQDPNRWLDLAPKLALQVWRDVTRNDDAALAAEARPVVEAVLRRVAAHDTDGDGLLDHGGVPDQTYDTWPMHGPSAYVGILWLGALRAAEELALGTGDTEAAAAWRREYERGRAALERLWRGSYFAFDGGGPTADSIMADQLAGQWYADVAGLGDLVEPDRIVTALRTIHERNVLGFRGGRLGPVNGMQPNGLVDRSSEQSQEVWVGSAYALAALMIGRGLTEEGWRTAAGPAHVTYERGLWFRTPEAYDEQGDYRPSLYVRPLAIWAIEEALRRIRARD
jgi:non-lysosomal glucosylceramidase